MKLTDEIVAKALGWKKQEGWCDVCNKDKKPHRIWEDTEQWEGHLPPFTTSLDAIVGEIEARGLWYELTGWNGAGKPFYLACLNKRGAGCSDLSGAINGEGSTAPLALCAALLGCLKEKT